MEIEKRLKFIINEVQHRRFLIAVTLISAIAMLARLSGLTFQGYWFDELYSVAAADPLNSFYEVLTHSGNDVHPPLYHTLLWVWFKLFGINEYTGRAFSALIGTLCLPALYVLGKEIFEEKVGIYAVAIASLNIFLIQYSQEVRPYSLLLLLSILSLFFYIKVLKTTSKSSLAGYILATVALLYTHYFGFIIIAIELIFLPVYLSTNRTYVTKILRYTLISAAITTLAILPIIPSILEDARITSFWILKPQPDFLIRYFKLYFGGSSSLILILLALMLKGFVSGDNEEKEKFGRAGVALIVLWLLMAYLIPYIRSITSTPVLLLRTSIIALPAIIYLAAFGLNEIKQKATKLLLLISLIFLSYANIMWENEYYEKITKEQYREVIFDINKIASNVQIYSLHNDNVINYNAYYRLLGMEPKVLGFDILKNRLKGSLAEDCFWIVDAHDMRKTSDLLNNFKNNNNLRFVRKIEKRGAVAILLCQRKG